MPEYTIIQQICIWAIPLLLAITLHEAAHGYVALTCGDTTAKMLGRVTLNPIKHIDPIGTILIPLVIGVMTQFAFVIGYAKPVPVNWARLKNPKRDIILVTLAGPFSNLLMAFLWMVCLKLIISTQPQLSTTTQFFFAQAQAGVFINLVFAFLNLLPIPPLDGSRVVSVLLPPRQAIAYSQLEPYGFFILILLALTGVLSTILTPLVGGGFYFLKTLLLL